MYTNGSCIRSSPEDPSHDRSAAHPTPLGDAALARLRETIDRGWAELDDAAVIKTYRA